MKIQMVALLISFVIPIHQASASKLDFNPNDLVAILESSESGHKAPRWENILDFGPNFRGYVLNKNLKSQIAFKLKDGQTIDSTYEAVEYLLINSKYSVQAHGSFEEAPKVFQNFKILTEPTTLLDNPADIQIRIYVLGAKWCAFCKPRTGRLLLHLGNRPGIEIVYVDITKSSEDMDKIPFIKTITASGSLEKNFGFPSFIMQTSAGYLSSAQMEPLLTSLLLKYPKQTSFAPKIESVFSSSEIENALLAPNNSNFSKEKETVALPQLLTNLPGRKFYTLQDVCRDTKAKEPLKRLALVMVKTHYCDTDSRVCLMSLAATSDRANRLIQDNFRVYHTRFYCQGTHCAEEGEKQIRDEWGKQDFNPEAYIVDVNQCKVIFRDYYSAESNVFATNEAHTFLDFPLSYVALRKLVLKNPEVVSLLNNRYEPDNITQIRYELAEAAKLRTQYPQASLNTVLRVADAQLKAIGFSTPNVSQTIPAILAGRYEYLGQGSPAILELSGTNQYSHRQAYQIGSEHGKIPYPTVCDYKDSGTIEKVVTDAKTVSISMTITKREFISSTDKDAFYCHQFVNESSKALAKNPQRDNVTYTLEKDGSLNDRGEIFKKVSTKN